MKISVRDISWEVEEGQYKSYWDDLNSGLWEPQTFRILDQFISAGDTVLDFGAWIGPITLYVAQSGAKVYAVEPDSQAFAGLENNIRLNPELQSNIKLFRLAISDKNEELNLYARKNYGTSSSSLLPRIRDGLNTSVIQSITIRKFIDSAQIPKVDFIKMDIEGGEFKLLPAMANELINLNFPTLYLSFHYNYLTEYHYRQKVKWKVLSLALMKLENWFKIEFFGRANRHIVKTALKSLKDYKFIYSDTGEKISFSLLQSNPLFIQKHNLIASNKEWIIENRI